MASLHVLVIDDEPALRQILVALVSKAGYSVDQASGVVEASAKLAHGDVDVALCDIKMQDGNGIDLLRSTRTAGIETIFIMITGFASVETAVEALRAGATDFITKPVRKEELIRRLSQIQAMTGLREENKILRKVVSEKTPKLYRFTSPSMLAVERLASKVAPTSSTVLIVGESGTGKGVAARMIHDQSDRCNHPFVQVNCSAIPENLLESEFFGHTKGAFTGADRARKGLFLQADGGTLFLDEIGELPLLMQTKLLHMVEEKEVRPLGSEQSRHVDTRIIAATNADLSARVAAGTFREDLFFRLAMFHIQMPPLRDRLSDLPDLIRFMLRNLRGHDAAPIEVDPLAEEVLLSYNWPGNVRELDNVINRAFILCEDNRVSIADLPSSMVRDSPLPAVVGITGPKGTLRDQMRRFELDVLRQSIDDSGGDRKAAAQRLGIGLSSLYRKLEQETEY